MFSRRLLGEPMKDSPAYATRCDACSHTPWAVPPVTHSSPCLNDRLQTHLLQHLHHVCAAGFRRNRIPLLQALAQLTQGGRLLQQVPDGGGV